MGERDGETGEGERQRWEKITGKEKTGIERELGTDGQTPGQGRDGDKETEEESERQKQKENEIGKGAERGDGEVDQQYRKRR